jgi:hypothetical protein
MIRMVVMLVRCGENALRIIERVKSKLREKETTAGSIGALEQGLGPCPCRSPVSGCILALS